MKIKVLSAIFAVGLFLFLGFLISFPNGDFSEEKIVTKIIDGDTIIVQGGETIRLLGIDCDERGRECYSTAKERIDELLLGESVVLEMDSEDKDRYGRSLRYIFLNGENINARLVEEGYCVARFVEDTKYKEEIIEVESLAIDNKIGCKWSKNEN